MMASANLYGCIQIFHKACVLPITHVDVTKKEFSFGRSLSCDMRMLDKRISASHCLLEVISADGAVCIRDISNRPQLLLRVNGVLKRKAILCHNDIFFLLDKKFRFQYPTGSRHHPNCQTYISPCEVNQVQEPEQSGSEKNVHVLSAPAAFVEEQSHCNERKNHMALEKTGGTSGAVSSLQLNENFPSRLLENIKQKDSVDKKQNSRNSKKKISFGPNLTPEHFDKALPVSTPVSRGRRPKSFNSNTEPDQHLGTSNLKPLVPILKCTAGNKRPDTPHVQKFKGGLKGTSSSKKSISCLSSVPEASCKVNVQHSPSLSSSQFPQIANYKSSEGIHCTSNETSSILIANPFISKRFQNNERVSIPPVPFEAETYFTENLEASSSFQTEATNSDVNNSVSYPKSRQSVCSLRIQNTSQGPDSQETCKEQSFLPLPLINDDANKLYDDIQIPGYSSPESENLHCEQSRAIHSSSVGNEVVLEELSGCPIVSIQGATSADAVAAKQDISGHSDGSVLPILYVGSRMAGEVSSTSESNGIYEPLAQAQVFICSSEVMKSSSTSFTKDISVTHPELHQSIEVMKIQNTSLGPDSQEICKESSFLPLPSSTENVNKLCDVIQMPDSTYPESTDFYSEQSGAILSNSVRHKVVFELPVGLNVSTQGAISAAITDQNTYEHTDGLVLQPPYVESMAGEVSSTSECNDTCDPIVQTRTHYHSTPIPLRVYSDSPQLAKPSFMEISELVSYAEVEKPVSRQFSLNPDTSFKDIEYSSKIGSCQLSPVTDTNGLESAVSSTVPVSLPSDLESMHVTSAHMRKDALDSPKLYSQSVTCLTSKTSASSVHKMKAQKSCNAFEKYPNAEQSISEVTTTNVMILRSKRTTWKITKDGVNSDSKSINLRSKSSKGKFSLKCSKAKKPSGEKKNISKDFTKARNLRQTKKKMDEMGLANNESLHLRNKRKCEGLGFRDSNKILKTNFEEKSAVSCGSAMVLRTRNASENVKGDGMCAYSKQQSKNLRKRAPVKFQKVPQKLNECSNKKKTVKKNLRQKKGMENERIPIMSTGRITKRKQDTRKKGYIYLSCESENKSKKNSSKPSKLSKVTGIKMSTKDDQLSVSHKQKSISPLQDGFAIQFSAKYLTRNAIKNKLNKKDIMRGDENAGALNIKLPLGCKTNKQSSQNIFDMVSQGVGNKEMSFEADIDGKRRLRSKIAPHVTIGTKTSLSRKKENMLSPVNKRKVQVDKKQVQLKAKTSKISKAVKRVDHTHDSKLIEDVHEKVAEVSLRKPMTRAMAKILIHA